MAPRATTKASPSDYDLPDETAYAETCATIGLVMWNQRLLQFKGERRFADVMERGLYNGFLSGVSLDGTRFLYENPLSTAGDRHHEEWFLCPCCPPNVARIIASIGSHFYSTAPGSLWVHLFGGNTATTDLDGELVTIQQDHAVPLGRRGEAGPCAGETADLHPAPARAGLVPGIPTVGQRDAAADPAGSQRLPGDHAANGGTATAVAYHMEMPIQTVFANPAVRQLEGRVAIQRGPVVYCLEGVDHGQIILDRIAVDPGDIAKTFTVEYRPDLLGGAALIHGQGRVIAEQGWENELYRSEPPKESAIQLTAIPYCTWDNRAPGEMRVWLRTK